jgi:hypothetical protein
MTNRRKILDMLANKKIDAEEADRLLSLIDNESVKSEDKENKNLKYLRVVIKPTERGISAGQAETVNVRVPMTLLRAGMKLTSIIPPAAFNQMDSSLKEKGIDFDLRNLKPENIEELIAAMGDLEVSIDNEKQTVRVYAE